MEGTYAQIIVASGALHGRYLISAQRNFVFLLFYDHLFLQAHELRTPTQAILGHSDILAQSMTQAGRQAL